MGNLQEPAGENSKFARKLPRAIILFGCVGLVYSVCVLGLIEFVLPEALGHALRNGPGASPFFSSVLSPMGTAFRYLNVVFYSAWLLTGLALRKGKKRTLLVASWLMFATAAKLLILTAYQVNALFSLQTLIETDRQVGSAMLRVSSVSTIVSIFCLVGVACCLAYLGWKM
ncbi:MAG TPA: hypothetical protein VIU29_06595, partial [Candidatus Deferrimicrobiaceae bacterium]